MHGSNIDGVTEVKLLGVYRVLTSSDLSCHSCYICMLQKVAKRMYCIIYLVSVPVFDILYVYC